MTSILIDTATTLSRLRAAARRIPVLGGDAGAMTELAVDLDALAAYQATADAAVHGNDETDEDGRPLDPDTD